MRTSIATVSLSGSLTEKLTAASRAGFDGVEIFENDLLASPLTPEEIRARCADLGLTIDLYQPMRDIEAVPADEFARNLRRARHKFELMRRLGADTVLVCSSVHPRAVDDDALAAEQLGQLAALAQDFGIRVAYEALAWGRHVNTYDHAWRIVEAAGHPALGTCLDSFHILSRTSDPKDLEGIEDIPGEKIFFLQLADAPLLAMDVLQWSRHYRCFPGQGGFDVAGLVRHVLHTGYDGPLSLEVFNDVFRQAEAGPTAVDAQRSLLVLQEEVGRTTPPAPVVPTGVAFAELVTPDAGPVSAVLGALGFTRTARHRSKPVHLWQQGEARILVNTQGSARRDGTGLAAIGLESPDPTGAAHRAEALLAPVLPRRRAPEDAPLDAVAAPDGTELFFCATDRPELPNWRADFTGTANAEQGTGHAEQGTAVAEQGTGAPGVTRIDHLALVQPWHHFDEATLFHHSVLGLHPQESVDVADPYGLMRSRAVTNADGSVRIALSVGAAPTDDTVHAQHIALATDDVVAAARRFRESGGRLLPIPANYYDDLAARYEFADGELETYRELGILYDRDAQGEFRHCYTVTVGRVFFELVQRDGYRGYGAQNAPVRLAAQHIAQ
ncbi:bifunctional sugar phosphate isomerase/epimerase/4-hydroxyphenylpyruvate dioxygenase family protein [Streptomyces sp. NBC_00299]|uniref:bifunctional sugar phosphate isomerase/epimerase/4-hydroxyphenylpyruvate dioxygenase family protein n=1 Tax=Streptomyces sp. NBC_00299 TaxID=2975705 RepID=UPI002E2CE198|nr:TIM barrel protein [Streptomyces sp. NBC_00299]